MAFLSLLVHYKWFETIYLVYLPVGHTHEKVDRDLFAPIGNRKKTEMCPTMALFPRFIAACFQYIPTRPECTTKVLNWDWKGWIEPELRDISQFVGFRAFKFCVNQVSLPVMFYRASILDKVWRGFNESHLEGSLLIFILCLTGPGIQLMRNLPLGHPSFLAPTPLAETILEDLNHLILALDEEHQVWWRSWLEDRPINLPAVVPEGLVIVMELNCINFGRFLVATSL
jgi:hypothetical protein